MKRWLKFYGNPPIFNGRIACPRNARFVDTRTVACWLSFYHTVEYMHRDQSPRQDKRYSKCHVPYNTHPHYPLAVHIPVGFP